MPADFAFGAGDYSFAARSGKTSYADGKFFVRDARPGHDTAIRIKTKSGRQLQIILLDNTDSLALWKGAWLGRERVFLTQAGLVLDGGTLRLEQSGTQGPPRGNLPCAKGNSVRRKGNSRKTRRYFRSLPTARAQPRFHWP